MCMSRTDFNYQIDIVMIKVYHYDSLHSNDVIQCTVNAMVDLCQIIDEI